MYSFSIQYKIEWKERKFRRQKNKKSDFYKNKKVTKIDDIDVDKILVSKEEPYGAKNSFKYFIGYNDNDAIRPLCMIGNVRKSKDHNDHKWPQMIGNVRKSKGNATMSFRISDKQLLKKYNQIWKRVEKLL